MSEQPWDKQLWDKQPWDERPWGKQPRVKSYPPGGPSASFPRHRHLH